MHAIAYLGHIEHALGSPQPTKQVPTYTLAIVFLFFCLLSILFEWVSRGSRFHFV